jgi:hypothetical protein
MQGGGTITIREESVQRNDGYVQADNENGKYERYIIGVDRKLYWGTPQRFCDG